MILSAKGSKRSEEYFGLYDVGEYLQAEDRAFYDCGYVKISVNNEKDMEISVQDKKFCITDDDFSERRAFCTILPYSGEYTVYNSSYIITADGSSCSADGAVYKNCCIEFTVDGQFTEGRSLYSGGSNRKHT